MKVSVNNTFKRVFGIFDKMKRILVIDGDGDIPDLNRSFTTKNLSDESAKKLKEKLPNDLEMKSIPMRDLPTLAEQVHLATKEAATNIDLEIQKFLWIDKALRRVKGEILNNAAKLTW